MSDCRIYRDLSSFQKNSNFAPRKVQYFYPSVLFSFPHYVFEPGPHIMGLGYARKRRLLSFPGLPRIYKLYKIAGRHSLNYPPSFTLPWKTWKKSCIFTPDFLSDIDANVCSPIAVRKKGSAGSARKKFLHKTSDRGKITETDNLDDDDEFMKVSKGKLQFIYHVVELLILVWKFQLYCG